MRQRFINFVFPFTLAVLILSSNVANAVGYYASGGKIYNPDGRELIVRGINHFGFNAGSANRINTSQYVAPTYLMPMYMWQVTWKSQLQHIKDLGFNAIRVPFGPDVIHETRAVDSFQYIGPNTDLVGKRPLEVLDLWMAEASRLGLYIMLDYHGVSGTRLYSTWFMHDPNELNLIYNNQEYSENDWIRDLTFLVNRYRNFSNVFAVDLFNEPNSVVRWDRGDVGFDALFGVDRRMGYWRPAVERASRAVLAVNPNVLIFVQGMDNNYGVAGAPTNVPINYGESFFPLRSMPLNIPADKLVLSPHTYGPSCYVKESFHAVNFPANLAADWEILFGQFSTEHPIIIGEWGGRYGVDGDPAYRLKDIQWQNTLVDYLISKGIKSSFYWAYTPNSGDVGGILADDLSVREDKMALLRRLWGATGPVTAPPPSLPLPVPLPPAPAPLPPAPAPQQPPAPVPSNSHISYTNFSPTSGPVGTVITMNGSGFTGVFESWVGEGKNSSVRVISDTQLQITVLAGASSGSIGIHKANEWMFTPSAFTVTNSHSPIKFSNISPTSGPVGTVITMNGSGFTGVFESWVGEGKNSSVRVINDRQLQITVLPGASSGSIGIHKANEWMFTPEAFTVY